MSSGQDKPPLTLRISVTDRCQLRCRYCMPSEGVPVCSRDEVLSFEEMTGFVARLQPYFDVRKVRLTGGDPLARRGIVELVRLLGGLGVPELALTTNGQMLAGLAVELKAAGLHRVNISVDSFRPDRFLAISRVGSLDRTLRGIDAALGAGLLPVRLNMVVMRGVNDDEVVEALGRALALGCELRFLELMPVGHGAQLSRDSFVPAAEVRALLECSYELAELRDGSGSPARRYRARRRTDGLVGTVGFISPCTAPFCGECTRLRLTADGYVIGCLASGRKMRVRELLGGSDADFLAVIRAALCDKRSAPNFLQKTAMVAIGG